MKLHEIITETPYMVPQSEYPAHYEDDAMDKLQYVNPDELKEEYRSGDVRIMSNPYTTLYMFLKDVPVGTMGLVNHGKDLKKIIGTRAWQVFNVFVLPEYRNKRLGMLFYYFVLQKRKAAFASGAAMTPSSRRVYGALMRDPNIDVYALEYDRHSREHERHELHVGPKGITTGDSELDDEALFVAVAHK